MRLVDLVAEVQHRIEVSQQQLAASRELLARPICRVFADYETVVDHVEEC